MCQRTGWCPICTMGFGRYSVSSRSRVPKPPARITTGISKVVGVSVTTSPRKLQVDRSIHEEERPLLGLDVRPADVLSENAEPEEHHGQIREEEEVDRREAGDCERKDVAREI